MGLPRLILIADRFTVPAVEQGALSAVAAGVPWVILRDRKVDGESFARVAELLVSRMRASAGPPLISVTARLLVAHALQANIHLGASDVSIGEARHALDSGALVGFSAHGVDEARQAVDAGADYVVFSPVFATKSKPGAVGAGVDKLVRVIQAVPEVPVFALGGISVERIRVCLDAGAHGVAAISGILSERDPAAAARRYLSEVTDLSR